MISKRHAYRSEADMERNDKFIFHISDKINGNLFSLEEAESIPRMPGGRPKLVESVRVLPRSTAGHHRTFYLSNVIDIELR